jgi:hypothetical protein
MQLSNLSKLISTSVLALTLTMPAGIALSQERNESVDRNLNQAEQNLDNAGENLQQAGEAVGESIQNTGEAAQEGSAKITFALR